MKKVKKKSPSREIPLLLTSPFPSPVAMNKHHAQTPLLKKQHSWSPEIRREAAWMRRKESSSLTRTKTSVTDDDLEELKGCIELGFGFDSSTEVDPKLADTLPALGLYQSVNRQYHRSLSRSSSAASFASSSYLEEIVDGDGAGSIYYPGDKPATVKTRLRQWAQVVACSIRQSSISPP